MPDLTIRSCPNFVHVSLQDRPNSACWISLSSGVGREAGGTAGGRQRTDSTHILARIRSLSRTLRAAQTMVYVLNVLSEVAPAWIRAHVPVEWVERYGQRLEEEREP